MEKKSSFTRLIEFISRVFGPVIPVLTSAGILKGILALLSVLGVLSPEDGTYRILYALADGFFYYLPVFLGYSGAKEVGANPVTGAFIGAALLYPQLTAAFTDKLSLSFLGLPVIPVTYSTSIVPIFLGIAVLGKVEPFFEKRMPVLIRSFATPLCSVCVVFPAILLLFGPMGALIGQVLAGGYRWLYQLSPALAGTMISAGIQPMVICGFHWSIFPICLENIALYQEDTLMPLIAPSVFAQAGAAFAVGMSTRDKGLKTTSVSAGVTALFGTTEAALFGCNIPLKIPFFSACGAAAVGGLIVGISNTTAKAFVFPSVVTLPVYLGVGFGGFILANILSFIIAFCLTWFLLKRKEKRL